MHRLVDSIRDLVVMQLYLLFWTSVFVATWLSTERLDWDPRFAIPS